jgi:hypothetical protein
VIVPFAPNVTRLRNPFVYVLRSAAAVVALFLSTVVVPSAFTVTILASSLLTIGTCWIVVLRPVSSLDAPLARWVAGNIGDAGDGIQFGTTSENGDEDEDCNPCPDLTLLEMTGRIELVDTGRIRTGPVGPHFALHACSRETPRLVDQSCYRPDVAPRLTACDCLRSFRNVTLRILRQDDLRAQNWSSLG